MLFAVISLTWVQSAISCTWDHLGPPGTTCPGVALQGALASPCGLDSCTLLVFMVMPHRHAHGSMSSSHVPT